MSGASTQRPRTYREGREVIRRVQRSRVPSLNAVIVCDRCAEAKAAQ